MRRRRDDAAYRAEHPQPAKLSPVKHWLATVGTERLEELENPALAIDRARQYYLSQGYSPEWIAQRLRSIVTRDDITEDWREHCAKEGREFANLTDTYASQKIRHHHSEHKSIKSLKKKDNLRDSMSIVELALTSLAEATSTALHREHDSEGFRQLQGDAREAGEVAGAARKDIETRLGRPVVTSKNHQSLTRPLWQPPLFGAEAEGYHY